MKTLKIKFTSTAQELTIRVVDFLGTIWLTKRTGTINNGYLESSCWGINNPEFESIKHWAFKDGIRVADQTWVKPAEVTLVSVEDVVIERIVNFKYHWFKPTIEYTDGITAIQEAVT